MRGNRHKFHPILHSASLLEERLRIQLAPLGIMPRQARVLKALRRMGAASQIELVREFDVTAASMSTMTARLISAGLISRKTKPDELRTNVLTLTEAGLAILDDIDTAWAEVDRILEEAIGAEKAAMLSGLTVELRNALGGKVAGAQWHKKQMRAPSTLETE